MLKPNPINCNTPSRMVQDPKAGTFRALGKADAKKGIKNGLTTHEVPKRYWDDYLDGYLFVANKRRRK